MVGWLISDYQFHHLNGKGSDDQKLGQWLCLRLLTNLIPRSDDNKADIIINMHGSNLVVMYWRSETRFPGVHCSMVVRFQPGDRKPNGRSGHAEILSNQRGNSAVLALAIKVV